MHSRWTDEEASLAIERWSSGARSNSDVALRVYTSRLIGADPRLVLHGGGNTSVKTRLLDDTGTALDVLCVKGSGWDLGDLEPPGLPAVRMDTLAALRSLDALSDEDMVNAARVRLLDAAAPNPSVEMLLHAFLPAKFIDHSHADAILAIVDQPDAAARCRDIFGDTLAIVPYVMPGFALAKLAAQIVERSPGAHGMLLVQHGLFTWGETARESYERHIAAVDAAERAVATRPPLRRGAAVADVDWPALAPIVRGRLGDGARTWVLALRTSPTIRAFVDAPELRSRALRGPATPDHVIRTKAVPLVLDVRDAGGDIAAYVSAELAEYCARYLAYFERQVAAKSVTRTRLDPDPRIVLVPGLGIVAVGADAKAARIAADVYEHTIDVIDAAERLGTYQALPDGDLFDMEYWSLEQAKLGAAKTGKPLAGRVVIVTGAAAGIGATTAARCKAAGAELWLVDRDAAAMEATAKRLGAPFDVLDVTSRDAVLATVRAAVAHFGGVDGLVSNAGTAPQSPIATCPPDLLRASLEVNLLAHQWFAEAVVRVMTLQGRGGFLVFNASKSAFNPGSGFGPYAIAKAGLVALMKQYAIEGGPLGIRSNAVNADRIRTSLLDPDAVAERARARGQQPDDYYRANLLGHEVTAQDVAEAILSLAVARSTTGAVVPVDGGNIAAAPR